MHVSPAVVYVPICVTQSCSRLLGTHLPPLHSSFYQGHLTRHQKESSTLSSEHNRGANQTIV